MKRVALLVLTLISAFTQGVPIVAVRDGDRPLKEIANYPLVQDGRDSKGGPSFALNNVDFKHQALYLNGRYNGAYYDYGYNAIVDVPSLNYSDFAVSLFFFPVRKTQEPILVGGRDYRWFSILREWKTLTVTFNNQDD